MCASEKMCNQQKMPATRASEEKWFIWMNIIWLLHLLPPLTYFVLFDFCFYFRAVFVNDFELSKCTWILNSKVSKEAHLIGITSGGLSFKYCTVVFVSRVIFVTILKLLFHINCKQLLLFQIKLNPLAPKSD